MRLSGPDRITTTTVGCAALALLGGLVLGGSGAVSASPPAEPKVQDTFDSLGPDVHAARLPSGRTAHYTDSGPRDGVPVLYIGGTGTSARAVHMTDFFRTTREGLGLRLISVERDGFGDTAYDPGLGKADFAQDALDVLDRLGVDRFRIIAISGGGPYAAELAARAPGRVSALHLAAALPPYGAKPAYCAMSDDALAAALKDSITDPRKWWAFPEDSPVRSIPGFADTAYEDGARTYNQRGQQADPAPQVHEQRLYCERPGPDLSRLTAPVYLYGGDKDTTVPPATLATWRQQFSPDRVTVRTYADSGHDVQYRHWDQILVDLAGHGDRTVVCRGAHTQVLPADDAERLVAKERATLGSCAWNK
ncbi:alpha/beta fold hydrolase [Streptomyces antnestii]|uniref:alpha/beta fold hydrolase n=1 Tax=Streptomyces antnestii TaxID=2494256 RepID=UPI001CB9C793|nr:alpha/beta hydrolase [Streptomyces sp. San01]